MDIKACVGQSYDGANVMSGHVSGVQTRIQKLAEWAIYVHCYAHRLNLVVVDSCKSVRYASDFFALLQRLYVFLSGSYVHPKWLSLQRATHANEPCIELKALSDTRWSAQIFACHAVRSRFGVLVELLQLIADESNGDRSLDARSLLKMIDLKFVFCLEMFYILLAEMRSASDSLQNSQLNAAVACDLIANCKDALQEKRNDDTFKMIFEAAQKTAETYELSSDILPRRCGRLPRRFEGDVLVTETIGRADAPSSAEALLANDIFKPVIDKALCELDRRFSDGNMRIMRSISALIPGNEHFLDDETIKPLAEHYRSNADDLSLELRQMKRMIERKTSEKTMPTFEGNKLVPFSIFVSKYEDAFFEMNRLLRIACTIPVTSVESERSFSCLKLIKTHLRTTMVHERLSNLIILSMHAGRAKALDLNKVLDKFIQLYPHCRIQLTGQ